MVRRWCGGGNSQPLPASISPTQHRPFPSNAKQSQQSASTNQCQPAPNNFKHFEFLQPTFNNPNQDQVTPSKSSQPQPYPAKPSKRQPFPSNANQIQVAPGPPGCPWVFVVRKMAPGFHLRYVCLPNPVPYCFFNGLFWFP